MHKTGAKSANFTYTMNETANRVMLGPVLVSSEALRTLLSSGAMTPSGTRKDASAAAAAILAELLSLGFPVAIMPQVRSRNAHIHCICFAHTEAGHFPLC